MSDNLQSDLAKHCMELEAKLASQQAAEARIKASQEQEPVAEVVASYVCPNADGMYRSDVVSAKRLSQGAKLFDESKVPEGWIPTDEELTKIYNDANGITGGKNPPISTQRIFTAMRAMLSAQPKEPKQ